METFTITNDDYVCIGPPESAIPACVEIESGTPPPTCWSEPPSTFAGGTVLVHAVDMRVPVLKGEWKASQLFNQAGGLAGGMVWHSSVGASEDAAVGLIRAMEDAGAPVICNHEPDAVLAQGVRFIGRYSWQVDEQFTDPMLDHEDLYYDLFGGPSCFFLPASTAKRTLIPTLKGKIAQVEALVAGRIQELKEAGQEKRDSKELRRSAIRDLSASIQEMAFPAVTCFEHSGVGFMFRRQEYLFGRLWFDSEVKCKAFLFYTYASPKFFGEMKLGNTPICPVYYPLMSSVTPKGDVLGISQRLTTKESAESAVRDMTAPLRHQFLRILASRATATLQLWFANHYLEWSTELFTMLCPELVRREESTVVAIFDTIPESVIKEAGESEVARFQSVSQRLRDGTLDLKYRNDAYSEATRPSHLARFIEKPACLAALLKKGYPARSTIAFRFDAWFRTPLADAADFGVLESVKLLVDAGANVDESAEGDPWNAIVYAVAGGSEEVVAFLKARYPDHPVWKRKDLPIQIKEMPSVMAFGAATENENNIEIVLGTLEDVKNESKKGMRQ